MAYKFNAGDKVLVKEFKPEYRAQRPGFVAEMEKCCGREYTVKKYYCDWVILNGLDYKWHEDWLELVEELPDIDDSAFEDIISMKEGFYNDTF